MKAEVDAKPRPAFRPVCVEVVGSLDDPVCCEVVRRMRQYRNRYAPILRLTTTLISPPVDEADLFGSDTSTTDPIEAGRETVTGEGSGGNGSDGEAQTLGVKRPRLSAPRAAITAEKGRYVIARRLHDDSTCPITALEDFMAFRFLPIAMTHNGEDHSLTCDGAHSTLRSHKDEKREDPPFVVRHYVHEATRTASFLIASPANGVAAVIDPLADITPYEADLKRLGVQLLAVVVTHCFVDVAMGHAGLLARHPSAVLLSGHPNATWRADPTRNASESGKQERGAITPGTNLPLPNDTAEHAEDTLALGDRLRLVAFPIAAFSPESMMVELHLDAVPLALFTGAALSADALPRTDLFASFPGMALDIHTAAEATRCALLDRVWRRRLCTDRDAHTLLLSSRGGYGNVTHQLDLHWAIHLGDMRRMRHTRVVLDTLHCAKAYATHLRDRPALPTPRLFAHVRQWNLMAAPEAFDHAAAALTYGDAHVMRQAEGLPTIVIDARDAAAHAAAHLVGSVNAPMSFPAAAYGAKKAELWLQCLLLPRQPVVVVCAAEAQCEEARRRLELISPGAHVEAFAVAQLQQAWPPLLPEMESEGKNGKMCRVPCFVASALLPRELLWVRGGGKVTNPTPETSRLESYAQLKELEPCDQSIVLDCRTTYEFQNGSHRQSVHLPLADLCDMTATDALRCSRSGDRTPSPSPALGRTFLRHLSEGAKAIGLGGEVRRVRVYCAAGYRSLIAASLLRRAFDAAGSSVDVRDVVGGALQIMKQRPDLWTVKDRSIICIS